MKVLDKIELFFKQLPIIPRIIFGVIMTMIFVLAVYFMVDNDYSLHTLPVIIVGLIISVIGWGFIIKDLIKR